MSIGIGLCDGSLGHPCGFTVLMLEEKERGKFGQGRRARCRRSTCTASHRDKVHVHAESSRLPTRD